jgi:hypothetical protein
MGPVLVLGRAANSSECSRSYLLKSSFPISGRTADVLATLVLLLAGCGHRVQIHKAYSI